MDRKTISDEFLKSATSADLELMSEMIKSELSARKEEHFRSLVHDVVETISTIKRCYPYASCILTTYDCEEIDLLQMSLDESHFSRL